jgi:hypothetical protein
VFEIDECVPGPESAPQLFPRDDLTGPFEEHGENLEGLLLQANPGAAFAQFSRAQINFEKTEANETRRRVGRLRGYGLHARAFREVRF